jgi:hypothetical protein
MDQRGLKNKDGWKARVPCINQLSGCIIDPPKKKDQP